MAKERQWDKYHHGKTNPNMPTECPRWWVCVWGCEVVIQRSDNIGKERLYDDKVTIRLRRQPAKIVHCAWKE